MTGLEGHQRSGRKLYVTHLGTAVVKIPSHQGFIGAEQQGDNGQLNAEPKTPG